MRHRYIVFGSLCMVLCVLAFIWWHSMQPGSVSHAESKRVLALVMTYVQGTAVAPYLDDWAIRRLAHLTEYMILGCAMSWFSFLQAGIPRKKWVLLLGICIAAIDEYMQQFSGGRTATWHDVVWDSMGCSVGIMMMTIGWAMKKTSIN